MNVKLKICGLREATNVAEVATVQPHYMGFIFYAHSPRFVGTGFSMPALPAAIQKVGVFVNADVNHVRTVVEQHALAYVQLHGHESPAQVKELSKNVKVIKAFSVDDHFDFEEVKPYQEYVQYLLFDTKGQHYGGNAKVFNWQVLDKYNQEVPFFLSGGISPTNVSGVLLLAGMNIHAIDVNSGVEQAPGIKDVEKIKELKSVINL